MASVVQNATANASPSQFVDPTLKSGIGLAQAAQQLEQQKAQAQATQQQLVQSKFNMVTGYMNTLARTSPAMAKRMLPMMQQNLQKAGIPIDPGILETMASEDEAKRRYAALAQPISAIAGHPEAMQAFLQAHQDLGDWDKGRDALETATKSQVQLGSQLTLQQAKQQGALQVAGVQAKGRTDAAAISGGNRLENTAGRSFSNIVNNKDVNSGIAMYQRGALDLNILNDAMSSGKGIPVQVLNEIASSQANMITNGKSALGDREANNFSNLNTSLTQKLNKLSASGVQTVNDPKLLQQIRDQGSRLFDITEKNVLDTTSKLKRTSRNDYINQTQEEAVGNVKKTLDAAKQRASGTPAASDEAAGFAAFVKSKGGNPDAAHAFIQQQGAARAPQSAGAPQAMAPDEPDSEETENIQDDEE